jgi:hypothetical protein
VELACKEGSGKAKPVMNMTMTDNLTDPSNLSTLDEPSLQTLINHYLRVREKLPDSVTVRDRLIELQDELLNRQIEREKQS